MNSNTINLVLGICVPALFLTLGSTRTLMIFDLAWLLLMTGFVLVVFARPAGVTRSGGGAILALYAVFVVVQIVAASS